MRTNLREKHESAGSADRANRERQIKERQIYPTVLYRSANRRLSFVDAKRSTNRPWLFVLFAAQIRVWIDSLFTRALLRSQDYPRGKDE